MFQNGLPVDRKDAIFVMVEHWAAMREVVSSTPAGTNTQGLKITEEKVLPL